MECRIHSGRVNPQLMTCGIFPILRVLDSNGVERQILNDAFENDELRIVYRMDGVEKAKEEANRVRLRFEKYNWTTVLRFEGIHVENCNCTEALHC